MFTNCKRPADDVWGGVCSWIDVDTARFMVDCPAGLAKFSQSRLCLGSTAERGGHGESGVPCGGNLRATRQEPAESDRGHGVPAGRD
jgi:hypothetical protein